MFSLHVAQIGSECTNSTTMELSGKKRKREDGYHYRMPNILLLYLAQWEFSFLNYFAVFQNWTYWENRFFFPELSLVSGFDISIFNFQESQDHLWRYLRTWRQSMFCKYKILNKLFCTLSPLKQFCPVSLWPTDKFVSFSLRQSSFSFLCRLCLFFPLMKIPPRSEWMGNFYIVLTST